MTDSDRLILWMSSRPWSFAVLLIAGILVPAILEMPA